MLSNTVNIETIKKSFECVIGLGYKVTDGEAPSTHRTAQVCFMAGTLHNQGLAAVRAGQRGLCRLTDRTVIRKHGIFPFEVNKTTHETKPAFWERSIVDSLVEVEGQD